MADKEAIHDSPEYTLFTSSNGEPSRELVSWAAIPENWHRARTCDRYSVCVIRTYGRPSRELVHQRSGRLSSLLSYALTGCPAQSTFETLNA